MVEKMKGTKKLVLSVVALVITLAMSVTATYAWFTTNTYATVNGFDVNVTTAEEGLFVRIKVPGGTEEKNYGVSVSSEDILESIELNNGGNEPFLMPLTSADGKTLKSTTAVIADSIDLGGEGVTWVEAANGTYAKFTLEFNSLRPGNIILVGKVGLNETSYINPKNAEPTAKNSMTAWTAITAEELGYGTEDYEAGDPIPLRAFNAARVSFVDGDTAAVWAPNDINDQIQIDYYLNAFNWTVGLPDDYKTNEAVKMVTPLVAEGEEYPENPENYTVICRLGDEQQSGGWYHGEVEILIWLDGNDGSAINNIIGDIFNVALQFRRIDKPVQG